MNKKPIIFLDVGGSAYNAPSEPVTNGLDSNTFLSSILEEYKNFLQDRITIDNLIHRMGSRLYNSGFFISLQYRLIYPDNEAEIFTGTYKERYEQANTADTAFGIQLRTSFEQDNAITLYFNNTVESKELVKELVNQLAEIINVTFDPNNDNQYLDEINIAEYSVYDDDIETRDLARGIQSACFPTIGICFGLESGGKLHKYLNSIEGMDKLVQTLSLFLDNVVEQIE
jgi:hypothetical protein